MRRTPIEFRIKSRLNLHAGHVAVEQGDICMSGVGKFVIWMCYAAAVAYVGYSWYTYSGLFRLAVEWQLATFESYSLKATLAVLAVALILPVAVVARLKGGPDLPTETTRVTEALKSPASLAVLGIVLLAVGAGAGWLGYQKSQETITYESVDLNAGQKPSSDHVVLTGVAHTEYLVQLESKRRGRTTTDNYFPLVSSAWRRGEPLVYFVKTNATAYLPQGGGQPVVFSRGTPFQMTTEKALLVRNGLPGPVGEAFRKTNTVADPPIVLDMNPNADFEMYWIGAIIGGFLGFGMLLTAAVLATRRRRAPLT
jgi:hypothetical protein